MIVLAAAALLLGLSSCNLDFIDNYSMAIGYEFVIEDEALRAEMQDFLQDFASQPGRTATFEQRSYSDAVALGQQFFTQALEELDVEFIYNHIQDEDDVIRMACVMSGTNLQEIISTIYWNWDWKQEMLLYGM